MVHGFNSAVAPGSVGSAIKELEGIGWSFTVGSHRTRLSAELESSAQLGRTSRSAADRRSGPGVIRRAR